MPKKTLEQKVSEREVFIQAVIRFVEQLLSEKGVITKQVVKRWNTPTTREPINFDNFSFILNTQKNECGGNDLYIWYHPKVEYQVQLPKVLVLVWDSKEKVRVDNFFEDMKWQRAIAYFMKHKNEVIKRVDAQKIRAEEKRQKDLKEKIAHDEKVKQTQARAKELRLA